ncbi:uncharacterized protein LOC105232244 isoform X2 [Bactrocera dorsalis]|uniref:Uncharacterized protein LOC105232244 isoform X2 n=1 Tax=Bactrocera dorsalis TaxID=27457 RepID=A0ABM3JTR2_BACDO|nr:uncharacterized protein LOC105232244 isoform X2 [Bactrocera dorsalis]
MMFSSADVAAVRHVVQRILVPCVFVVGLLGNSVSIYVLTRKRMRCTTNIYLTALAITDIIYLTMALLLSLQHYDYVQRNVEIFWKCYGYVVWLCDACAYISIYIAVCFTIERFIAIRYPLKRQTFCTESLAKKVITGVALFCLFSTISTAFEHQYRITKKSIDIHGVACNITQANASERLSLLQLNYNESVQQQQRQEEKVGRMKKQNDALHLPLQHYMPLPKSAATTTPHIDFEGSGQAAADERTEHTAHHLQTQAVDSAIGAVVSKKDNLASSSGGSNVGDTESNAWRSKPDVILRRLKRTVELNKAAPTTGSTTPAPLTRSLATPLPIALTTAAPLPATHEWFALAAATSAVTTKDAQMKVSRGSVVKRALSAAVETHIPRIMSSYYLLDSRADLLLDTEFLVRAATPTTENADEGEQTMKDVDRIAEQGPGFEKLTGAGGWAANVQSTHGTQDAETVFFNITDYCEEVIYYQHSQSSLGENALYTRLWYFFTLFVFVLIPLCLLGTFNCFLIMLVRRSKNLRGEMTNANSIRRSRMSGKGQRKSHASSVSQENRITVTLIAVVLLFIICQLPWAIYLIVSENVDIDNNLQAIIGNIFNFLADINAAANFFLYCVLSDKYRKTVRELITGYKYRAHARHATASTSLYTSTHGTHSVNGSRRYRPTAASIVVK